MNGLIRIYNFICRFYSLFINFKILCKYIKNDGKETINNYKLCKFYFGDIQQKFQIVDKMKTFTYVSDPEMKLLNKVLKRLTKKDYYITWDFIPWLFIFFLQDGSDCSGFSHIYTKLFKQIKIPVTQYVLYDNVGNFFDKLNTLHMVTEINYFGKKILFNVTQEVQMKGSIAELFHNNYMVIINGENYKYKKPVIVKWF